MTRSSTCSTSASGNGTPWNQAYRSPGGGDNLYISSIIALKPETGDYVWHYQTTPGDTWDFDATQHMILADLEIGGQPRQVLMQASKNGFFYVLDRATGELISAANFVAVNWAKGIDVKSGRPIENPDARIDKTGKPFVVVPGPGGAHSWQPTAYDPKTGLVYIPAQEAGFPYVPEAHWKPADAGLQYRHRFRGRRDARRSEGRGRRAGGNQGRTHRLGPGGAAASAGAWTSTGHGTVACSRPAADSCSRATRGKEFVAYDAGNGAKLWSSSVQTGILAAPVTYSIKGEQYVAVLAGWGGIWALAPGILSEVGRTGPQRVATAGLQAGRRHTAATGAPARAPAAGPTRCQRHARAARAGRAALRALLQRLSRRCGLRQHRAAGPAPQHADRRPQGLVERGA